MKIFAQLGQSFFRRQVCRLKLTEQDIAVNRHDSSPANLPAGAYAGARVRGKAAPAFVTHRPKGGALAAQSGAWGAAELQPAASWGLHQEGAW